MPGHFVSLWKSLITIQGSSLPHSNVKETDDVFWMINLGILTNALWFSRNLRVLTLYLLIDSALSHSRSKLIISLLDRSPFSLLSLLLMNLAIFWKVTHYLSWKVSALTFVSVSFSMSPNLSVEIMTLSHPLSQLPLPTPPWPFLQSLPPIMVTSVITHTDKGKGITINEPSSIPVATTAGVKRPFTRQHAQENESDQLECSRFREPLSISLSFPVGEATPTCFIFCDGNQALGSPRNAYQD
uniref:Uncharacterized protein n=1 Tax=Cannabis sativa TaxID=3483 RepID=A0A803NV87_CANSA